jgi:small subunit ribosomal protein S17
MTEINNKKKRTVKCVVVSDKMDKTRVGLVERIVKHPVVGKYIKRSTKIHFHDEKNQSKKGDAVSVVACRPLSKKKSFTLLNQ